MGNLEYMRPLNIPEPLDDPELRAIEKIIHIMLELEYSTRARVLNYIAARYAA